MIVSSVNLNRAMHRTSTTKSSEGHQRTAANSPSALEAKARKINHQIVGLGKKQNWGGILQLYQNKNQYYTHVNYATSMSQLGRIRSLRKNDTRLEKLMVEIASQLENPAQGSWRSREISNVLHAVAKLQLRSSGATRLVNSILHEQNVTNIVRNGTPQAIANTAWACAKLGVQCPCLFQGIEEIASDLVQNGKPQDIANTAWACASLSVQCPSLFQAIDENATYLVLNGKPQEIANATWACATLGYPRLRLFQVIEEHASNIVQNVDPQAIANIAWSFATLGVECPRLFRNIDEFAATLFQNGNPQAIANTAWACATLGAFCPTLFMVINSHTTSMVQNCNQQEITNLCYAFSILDSVVDYEFSFRILWDRAMAFDSANLSAEARTQLVQTFVMSSTVLDLPPPVKLLHCVKFIECDRKESQAQREMCDLLNELGFAHEVEVSPIMNHPFLLNGMLAIDAACKERMIAIEFDGPSHFLKDVATGEYLIGTENGATKAKRRFLERLGWKVINVGYWEWSDATNTRAQKKQVLAEKLASLEKQ